MLSMRESAIYIDTQQLFNMCLKNCKKWKRESVEDEEPVDWFAEIFDATDHEKR